MWRTSGPQWVHSPISMVRRVVSRDVCRHHPGPLCLGDGGALRGSCRASPKCVYGCLLLRGRLLVGGVSNGITSNIINIIINNIGS